MGIGFSSDSLSKYNFVITDIYIKYLTNNENDYLKSLFWVSPIYPIMNNDMSPLEEYIDLIIGE